MSHVAVAPARLPKLSKLLFCLAAPLGWGIRIDSDDDEGANDVLIAVESSAGAEFELVFVTDCTPHQRWMAFNVLNSAHLAGQKEPMTWIRSGCKSGAHSSDAQTIKSLYPAASLLDVQGEKGKDNFNLAGGVPMAMQRYLDTRKSIPNSTVVSLIEADMIFLSPLRIDDLESRGVPMPGRKQVRHGNSLLGGNVGVAQRYLCCDDLGPPYILTAESWRKMTPLWNEAFRTGGWGADQVAFAKASKKAGLEYNVFSHFMVSSMDTTPEGWKLVDKSLESRSGNDCATGHYREQPGVDRFPTLLHVVQPWTVGKSGSEAWGFSKYQVPPGWSRPTETDGILECGMPFFAQPPPNLLEVHAAEKRQGWVLCTIFSSLNAMLTNYKKLRCPAGFNEAKALKMKVPLQWTNVLLEGAVQDVPKGTNITWMKRCAEEPQC